MKCPACKSSNNRMLDDFDVVQDHTQDVLPPTFKILICNDCNLYFKEHLPDWETLEKFYNTLGDKYWESGSLYPHEIYLSKILGQLPDNSNVLDVGCNTGRLLAPFTKKLICHGVEVNKEAAMIAENRGVKIVAPNITDQSIGENRYDLITLVDVFEHLTDPLPFIEILVKAIAPGGCLYIFTGRTDCLPANIARSHYWYYKPAQHLIFLNKKFVNWFNQANPNLNVQYKCFAHFNSNYRQKIYHISWYVAWRLFSPSSPYRLFSLRNLVRMKEPFMITSWKDHAFVIIKKNEND